MEHFCRFLEQNGIRQVDIANYLNVSKSYISLVVLGKSKLSSSNLMKILDNKKGWDTSMLIQKPVITQHIGDGSSNNTQVAGTDTEIAVLKERVRMLEKLLEERERTIQLLMELKNR